MVTLISDPPQSLVTIDKDSDTFSITIPEKAQVTGIAAEFLPELRDQLNISGGFLSCWSWLYGEPLDDSDPEQTLQGHTAEFISSVLSLLGYHQLQRLLNGNVHHGAIRDLIIERLTVLDDANRIIAKGVH